jgi:hypothetical protein
MKTINVNLDAARLARLAAGETLTFKLPEGTRTSEIRVKIVGKSESDFSSIDGVFERLWSDVVRRLDKIRI